MSSPNIPVKTSHSLYLALLYQWPCNQKLPPMMQHELNDIWVFCQIPQTSTQLLHHHRLCFCSVATKPDLIHTTSQFNLWQQLTNCFKHFYFKHLPIYGTLCHLLIYQEDKKALSLKSRTSSGNTLSLTLTHPIPVPIISVAHAPNVWFLPNQLLKLTLHAPRPPLLNSLAAIVTTHHHF